MTKVSILGCGWLGLPLAAAMVQKSFVINGSTTSLSKIPQLESFGIHPFLISLSEEKINGDISEFLSGSEILIIDIPPKLRNSESESFIRKIKNLHPFIEASTIQKVLFVSSISVYAEGDAAVNEDTLPNPESESGKQLLTVENLLQSNRGFATTIIRFGGLIGEDRHPVNSLSGKSALPNPEASINLIHLEDCIGIILKIVEAGAWNDTFNAVAPYHPSRESYYSQIAAERNLEIPKFDSASVSKGKTISSQKLESVLEYQFIKPKL